MTMKLMNLQVKYWKASSLALVSVLAIAGSYSHIRLNDIKGVWRADVTLPGGIRVQSVTFVNQGGSYLQYLTNDIANQKRTATLAGTLIISNGWLFDTITNDFHKNTIVPRSGGVWQIIGLSSEQLSLADTNGLNTIVYRRDTNLIDTPSVPDK